MGNRADRAGDTHDQQRSGNRFLCVHTCHVSEQRDGENRAPATEQSEGDTDEHCQSYGQRDHDQFLSARSVFDWTSCATMLWASHEAPRL